MPDNDGVVSALVGWLEQRTDCLVEPGLSADEIAHAEATYGLNMPPVWKAVLVRAHPIALPRPPRGKDGILRWMSFPDWRLRDPSDTRRMVEAPVVGLMFDVEKNDFWWRAWGPRPDVMAERLSVARAQLALVPRLTPLWGHQYVGSEDDGPVFSIVQADLYVPALNLFGLLDGRSEDPVPPEDYPIGRVPFWSDLHAYSQVGHFTTFGELAEGGL